MKFLLISMRGCSDQYLTPEVPWVLFPLDRLRSVPTYAGYLRDLMSIEPTAKHIDFALLSPVFCYDELPELFEDVVDREAEVTYVSLSVANVPESDDLTLEWQSARLFYENGHAAFQVRAKAENCPAIHGSVSMPVDWLNAQLEKADDYTLTI